MLKVERVHGNDLFVRCKISSELFVLKMLEFIGMIFA